MMMTGFWYNTDSPNEELTSTAVDSGEILGHWGGGLHDPRAAC